MDIGTAKPSPDQLRRLPHHLIDVVDPDEPYSLALYQRQAHEAIERIAARGRLPLLVGGAGLYVSAVCDGLTLPDAPPDRRFRETLEERARTGGWEALQRELTAVDPMSAGRIDPRNVRRVIRALEVYQATGRPFSDFQQPSATPPARCVTVGLRLERQELYARIDTRIDAWIAGGFIDEVRGLLERGYAAELPSMSSLGYRQIAQYLAGTLDVDTAVAQFKQATHQYAKRQMTWFNRRSSITWFDAATVTVEQVLQLARSSLAIS
jgi:tRNA dimethylallyltransferase